MITSLVIKNAVDGYATSLALDTIDGTGVGYPLRHFEWHHATDGADIAKTHQAGEWSWQKWVRTMTITMEGSILANSTTQYWTQRKALMRKALPDPSNTEFDPIKFELVLDGDGNTYFAFCEFEDAQGALDVEATHSPMVSEFQITYRCRAGYWTGPTGLVIL